MSLALFISIDQKPERFSKTFQVCSRHETPRPSRFRKTWQVDCTPKGFEGIFIVSGERTLMTTPLNMVNCLFRLRFGMIPLSFSSFPEEFVLVVISHPIQKSPMALLFL